MTADFTFLPIADVASLARPTAGCGTPVSSVRKPTAEARALFKMYLERPLDENAALGAALQSIVRSFTGEAAAVVGGTVPVDGVRVLSIPNVSASRVERTPTEVVVSAAAAVAEAMTVSTDAALGDGEIVVRLRTDVLGGSVVRVNVSGTQASVCFQPMTSEAERLLAAHVGALGAHLAQAVPAYHFRVQVAAAPGPSSFQPFGGRKRT